MAVIVQSRLIEGEGGGEESIKRVFAVYLAQPFFDVVIFSTKAVVRIYVCIIYYVYVCLYVHGVGCFCAIVHTLSFAVMRPSSAANVLILFFHFASSARVVSFSPFHC